MLNVLFAWGAGQLVVEGRKKAALLILFGEEPGPYGRLMYNII
jgi:hypothetical protein